MGTSTARKAPGGKYWRTAKTAMARFASGKEATPPQVNEVVARYLTALKADDGKGSGDTAFLPTIARTAASLGNFYRSWRQDGWEAALASLGVNPANRPELMPALLDRLAGPGGTLAEAVARAALLDHLAAVLSSGYDPATPGADSEVNTFLGLALKHKLLSDLGETVEFHAPTVAQGMARQEEIRAYFLTRIRSLESAKPDKSPFDETGAILNTIFTVLGDPHGR